MDLTENMEIFQNHYKKNKNLNRIKFYKSSLILFLFITIFFLKKKKIYFTKELSDFTSYSQYLEDLILFSVFYDVKNGFYIDIGANDPNAISVTKNLYIRGWYGINIEPLPNKYQELVKFRLRDISLQLGAGKMKENKTLFLFGYGSSLYKNEIMENNKTLEIEVDTMSNICRKYVPKNESIQFCKIDVEGGEKNVLLGYDFENYRPKVFCIEATLPGTNIPCHDLWEDILIANEIGFNNVKRISKKKIGVIGEHHSQNIGNNLLKYAMFVKLKEFGFEPDVIGYLIPGNNISFLNKTIKIRIIRNSYKEIKRNDYDLLMVNSDQVWRKGNYFYLDIGFLKFSHNWDIKRFIYGASMGLDFWAFKKRENCIMKHLLTGFSGVSVREQGTMRLVESNLNIKSTLVIDPTLLIDKKYYLNLIKDYKNEFNSNDNYIFVYEIEEMPSMELFIKESVQELKYKLYNCSIYDKDSIEKFIYGIYNSKAVITNSFHGILFSIIFKKPFVAFNPENRGNERFNTLKDVYGIQKRIVSKNNQPNISLLIEPFDVDMKIFNDLRTKSIVYLKKNLGIEKNGIKNNEKVNFTQED